MRRGKIQHMVVKDHDRKAYKIYRSVSDNTFLTNRVNELQHKGRNINCCGVPVTDPVERLMKECEDGGYSYADDLP